MNYFNKDRNDIYNVLNIPYTTFTDWYNATIYPRIDKIEMLTNYFGVKKSDLIENKYKDSFDGLEILFDKNKKIIILGLIIVAIIVVIFSFILISNNNLKDIKNTDTNEKVTNQKDKKKNGSQ